MPFGSSTLGVPGGILLLTLSTYAAQASLSVVAALELTTKLMKCARCRHEIPVDSAVCPHCDTPHPRLLDTRVRAVRRFWAGVGVCAVLTVLLNLHVSPPAAAPSRAAAHGSSPPTLAVQDTAPMVLPDDPTSAGPASDDAELHIDQVREQLQFHYKGRIGDLSDELLLDGVIANPTSQAVKDMEITCFHVAPSGTVLGQSTDTLLRVVPARGRLRFTGFRMGPMDPRAVRVECGIDFVRLAF